MDFLKIFFGSSENFFIFFSASLSRKKIAHLS